MINIQLYGDTAVVARFKSMNASIHLSLLQTITALSIKLKSNIINNKLSGQVLNHRSGNLWRSIQYNITSTDTNVTGKIFSTNVEYAGIHEYGGTVRTRLGTGVAKPKPGGKATFEMPERSFMRSALADMRLEIQYKIEEAIGQGTK